MTDDTTTDTDQFIRMTDGDDHTLQVEYHDDWQGEASVKYFDPDGELVGEMTIPGRLAEMAFSKEQEDRAHEMIGEVHAAAVLGMEPGDDWYELSKGVAAIRFAAERVLASLEHRIEHAPKPAGASDEGMAEILGEALGLNQ